MSAFLVAQPFRAAEESPHVGWSIVYILSLHGVTMVLSAGLKPRGYGKGKILCWVLKERNSQTSSLGAGGSRPQKSHAGHTEGNAPF
ncbi:MAG: hypothetical protein JG766_873 [Desulfacinum sp.]|jgi:hypothetical protein|nr:hypothetical protein [Desulfacinum sp.]